MYSRFNCYHSKQRPRMPTTYPQQLSIGRHCLEAMPACEDASMNVKRKRAIECFINFILV